MRRVIAPAPNENPVEDCMISYYEFDGNGNIALKTAKIEIPLGLGRYAFAAMSKGWLDFFNGEIMRALGTTGDVAVFEQETDKLLSEFKSHLLSVVENRRKQEAESAKSKISIVGPQEGLPN